MATLLIVDDEENIRFILQSILEDQGYKVLVTEQAEQAMHLLNHHQIDVVFCDINLPRTNGMELLSMIREKSADIQVIMMTGMPSLETATTALRDGAFDYLCKPMKQDAVLHCVRNAVKAKLLADERTWLLKENFQYQRDLEARLNERTAELKDIHDQLVAQERLKALGQMASGIAHDFNNSLAVINGFTDLMLMRNDHLTSDKREYYLKLIQTAAHDASMVVNRMREFYRHRDSRDPVASLSPNDLIKQTIELVRPRWENQAQAKGIDIQIKTCFETAQHIAGCESELREAFTNLIINAVDAMPEGGQITFRTYVVDQELYITISDTGTGMSEQVKNKCLQAFFSTKGSKGTGLGLASVVSTVESHSGRMTLDSIPGQGTTFTIRFPILAEHVTPETRLGHTALIENTGTPILVVDDDDVMRAMLHAMLSEWGYDITLASSGSQALQFYREKIFPLVITDLAMPEMNGQQLTAEIRRDNPHQRILMLTGFGEFMKDVEENLGVDRVLGKPVKGSDLHKAIKTLLS